MVGRIRSVEGERNEILHSFWDPLSGKPTVLGQKWGIRGGDKWYQPRFVERSIEDLQAIADRIESVADAVGALHDKLAIEVIRAKHGDRRG